ncbi:uncharacterized protein LOC108632479 [Ceratina calcarata]|uniref:Uncharacterized protein LOC108632479 n=1 Tax=Ceratina calcarata TaxID=156304 RepID=A0AAJ7JG20_9HYME|nr:uncharacterized protein LOC108632479 [Ceratina calcarata]
MDFWTNNHTKTTFYTITAHYLKDWKLVNRILFTMEFPEHRKTVDNIKRELVTRFAELGISPRIMKKITFTTDQGSNIVKALKDNGNEPINCAAHLINCALKHGFKEDETEELTQVTCLLEQTKNIVAYMKRTGYVFRLPLTLHQKTEVRWNSKIKMVRSVVEQFTNIRQILEEVDQAERIEEYNLQQAEGLNEFLQPFEEAIVVLQVEKSPTLHLVPL